VDKLITPFIEVVLKKCPVNLDLIRIWINISKNHKWI
jgi:hypothetical protein